jgi:hypothetical protein
VKWQAVCFGDVRQDFVAHEHSIQHSTELIAANAPDILFWGVVKSLCLIINGLQNRLL